MGNSHQNIQFPESFPSSPDEKYTFYILDPSVKSEFLGFAEAEILHDSKGKFWHLYDVQIQQEFRRKGYGTLLVNHACERLVEIQRLGIRVHPAIGQQAMEYFTATQTSRLNEYTPEELDAQDNHTVLAIQKPGFWENTQFQTFDSTTLVNFYRKNCKFTVDDPDGKHLWRLPSAHLY